MDKKPLIGVSICAVVLLILGSLTNVVGYQSVKSTAMSESPLFSLRTQRANNQKQNIITSQYLGKGKGNLLQFSLRDNTTEVLKNIIKSIKKMDDATFQRFLILVKQRLKETASMNEMQLLEINEVLTKIRNQADLPVLSPSKEPPTTVITCGLTVGVECWLFIIFVILFGIIDSILFIIRLPFYIIYYIIYYILKLPGNLPS